MGHGYGGFTLISYLWPKAAGRAGKCGYLDSQYWRVWQMHWYIKIDMVASCWRGALTYPNGGKSLNKRLLAGIPKRPHGRRDSLIYPDEIAPSG